MLIPFGWTYFQSSWGPLVAGYALASLPIIVLFVFSMKLFVRGLTEGAVKG